MLHPRLGRALGAFLALAATACDGGVDLARAAPSEARLAATELRQSSGEGPLHVEAIDGLEPPVFALHGRGIGAGRLVFLHGMCGHGLGYAQAFQFAAAKKGMLIAPQADRVCGDGPWAKWSLDVAAIDARIVEAFRKLGDEGPIVDVCVLGVSQGATRAVALVRQYPERYSRLVSIGAPTEVQTAGLERLRSAIFMVGERERKDLMLTSERALRKVGVPSRAVVIPNTDHANLGPTPEQTMGDVLDWLWAPPRE